MSDYLPEEVIIQILHNLPVKSLIKCTSVCKLWHSLIKNPNFISAQIAKTSSINIKSNPNPLLLSHFDDNQYSLGFDNQEFKDYMPLHFPFKSDARYFQAVAVGYSNGLLCLCDRRETLSRMIMHLDDCGKIQEPKIQIEIYSLNLNLWKIITGNAPTCWIEKQMVNRCPLQNAAYVNNALHWIAYYSNDSTDDHGSLFRYFILVFDLKDEVFREIMLPNSMTMSGAFRHHVKVFGDSSIGVFDIAPHLCWTDIWVMKEYGVAESWVNLPKVGDQKMGILRVLGFKKNGEVILEFGSGQSSASIPYAFVDTYLESLALFDKGNVVKKKSSKERHILSGRVKFYSVLSLN
ncbi:F-box protein At3g07870 isoform X2 [Jatropha curcas]|uniref:F-box protein At3g07870 isoform X2 n=1 Tax=Jatropha curcas TaxID=180498 RepID=UPI0005FB2E56|nr:F-box protein At3g07870 isoform X2 [Jatropha curcas]